MTTGSTYFSLPLRGRAAALHAPPALIPAFPRKGKEQDR